MYKNEQFERENNPMETTIRVVKGWIPDQSNDLYLTIMESRNRHARGLAQTPFYYMISEFKWILDGRSKRWQLTMFDNYFARREVRLLITSNLSLAVLKKLFLSYLT